MTHRIKKVKALDNYVLSVLFQNGVKKEYDLKKIIVVFPQLDLLTQDKDLYQQVQVDAGGYGISWNDELDLDADEIWKNGMQVTCLDQVELMDIIGARLTEIRCEKGITQRQLSQKTGIYQADISKIERGLANPSLSTLERLANGLEMKIVIGFEQLGDK